jgi:hypothetical protein
MAQIIRLDEIAAARERDRRIVGGRASLESAVVILKENLAAVAMLLIDAPAAEQDELLSRIERLTALIRYGTRMIGDPAGSGSDCDPTAHPGMR